MTNPAGRKVLGILVVTLVLVACATADPAAIDETTTTAVEASTTAAAETTTTIAATTTTTLAATTTTTEATPTTEQYDFVKPVTITMPSDWVSSLDPTAESLALLIEAPDGVGAFLSEGAETTVDSWVERLISHDNLETTEPVASDVGGAPGFWFDARIGNATEGRDCGGTICVAIADPPGEGEWFVIRGAPNRVWIVDVDGTAVLITAEASEAGFEEFVAAFEEVLATVEWAEG